MKKNAIKIVSVTILLMFALVALFTCAIGVSAVIGKNGGVASALDVELPANGVVCANLLLNSDFVQNSNGKDSYNTQGYTYDDWYLWNGLGTVQRSSRLFLYANNNENQNLILSQKFDYTKYKGENLTLSFLVGTEVFSYTVTVPDTITDTFGVYYFRDIANVAYAYVRFGFYPNGSPLNNYTGASYQLDIGVFPNRIMIISWIKCEQGSAFTGYVPNYQDTIKDLQDSNATLTNEKNNLQSDLNDLQNRYDTLLSSNEFLQIGSLYSYLSINQYYASRLTASIFNYGGINYNGYQISPDSNSTIFSIDLSSVVPAKTRIKFTWDLLCITDRTITDYYIRFAYVKGNPTGLVEAFVVDNTSFKNGVFEFVPDYDCYGFIVTFGPTRSASGWTEGKTIFFDDLNVYAESSNYYSLLVNSYNEGYFYGQKVGYDEGYRVGNNKGYADGQASQGDYTFFGLISSVVDAPLSVFRTMFNFEILGMNLSSFLLSLFSISVILCVVKLLIGR